MANPIKYSTGSESLALKKGNWWIGTGDVGKGPTSTTGYYNGITPPSGGYTIYLNKATGGPSIYTCANDTELVGLTNSIAGTTYTTLNECLTYFAGQEDKICFNRDYESIVTDGLVVNLDGGFISSYPRNGNTWYDLSTSQLNATLLNSPDFLTPNGGLISFDGIDSEAIISGSGELNFGKDDIFTLETWVKPIQNPSSGNTAGILGKKHAVGIDYYFTEDGNNRFRAGFRNATDGQNSFNSNTVITPGNWYHVVFTYTPGSTDGMKLYINGELDTTASNVGIAEFANDALNFEMGTNAALGGTSTRMSTSVGATRIYNRDLSALEVYVNYNAFKDRLIGGYAFKIDAADPASYPGSGTTVTSIGSETFTSTLESGASYSSENEGVFVFDGTDDIARSTIDNFDLSNTSFTIDCWFKADQEIPAPSIWGFVGGGFNNTGMAWSLQIQRYNNGNKALRMDIWGSGHVQFLSSDFNELGWNHYAATFEAPAEGVELGEMKIFLNGSLYGTPGTSFPIANNEMPLEWGSVIHSDNIPNGQRAFYSDGRFGPIRIWKKALTENEILQQYNSEKDRFTPSYSEMGGYAFKIDAADPASYPGSGTTVTSVGDETFTSTLYGGASYSSEGGGSFLFDGTDDIAISDISNFNIANMSFTVDSWFKFASPPDTESDDRHGFIGGGGWGGAGDAWRLGGIRYSSNGYEGIDLDIFGDGAHGPVPSGYDAQEWNHYCGTFDISTGDATIYLNGVQLNTSNSIPITRDAMPLEWGAVIYSANTPNGIREYYQNGYIGPTRIWKNKALSQVEVAAQYNSEKDRFGL